MTNNSHNIVVHSVLTALAFAVLSPQTAQAQSPAGGPAVIQSMRSLTLEVQLAEKKCEQKTLALAKKVFDQVVVYRKNHGSFPNAISELNAEDPSSQLPPSNPFCDPADVSSVVRKEMQSGSGPKPPEKSEILIEPDARVSGSLVMTLGKVKLIPAIKPPGSIIVKYNGDYYLAVWATGFYGKPILDEKTNVPKVFFKDFSMAETNPL